MNERGAPPMLMPVDEEVGQLIDELHRCVQRLETLSAGVVDDDAVPGARSYLVPGSKHPLPDHRTCLNNSVLDVLPAHVALLDAAGKICTVNEAWRRFGRDNGATSAQCGAGLNYLEVCERAGGAHAEEALAASQGIRDVLAGAADSFSIEYPCHSPHERRWFVMTVTPLADDEQLRAIVMHFDVSALKLAKEALQEGRQRLIGVIDSAMDAIISVEEGQRIVMCNPAAEAMFGYTAAQLRGMSLSRLLPERVRDLHASHMVVFGATGVTQRKMGKLAPIVGLRSDGEEFPIEASISKYRSHDRWVYTAILRDITERTRAEHRIGRLNRLYAMLGGINMLIVRARDRDMLFSEACRIAVEAGGFLSATVGAVDPVTLEGGIVAQCNVRSETVEQFHVTAHMDAAEQARPDNRALRLREPVVCNDIATDPDIEPYRGDLLARGRKAIACFPLSADGLPDAVLTLTASEAHVFDEDELKLLIELSSDLSFAMDHLAKEARLAHLAFYDALTGLANHGLYMERLSQHIRSALAAGRRLAVCVLDLDRFRMINDSFGRSAGDELLIQVADWLKLIAGDATLLCRISPDRFAAVLPLIREDGDLHKLFESIQSRLSAHPFRLNDAVFRIVAKMGVAIYPNDGASAEVLFKNAEAALKKAKSSGAPLLFYAQSMSASSAGHPSLENQLRQALERNEYVLHYQPKVSLQTGKLTSVEALIRWNDPQLGMVLPGRFIPVLEETGLIHDVGRWALIQALTDYRRWCAEGLGAVRIAVNVSPLQLRNRGFVTEIQQALGRDEQSAAGLELEITESLIMEDMQHSVTSLQAIRAMGVHVTIDDFGTGFSSLSYLSRLPVDKLKIDRTFIHDMSDGPQGLALVHTIISLAHALNLEVVAEGVETKEQSRLLRLLNCDEMQGFLFSRPLPVDVLESRYLIDPTGNSLAGPGHDDDSAERPAA